MGEPLSKLDTNGKATEISYNVPEPTSYPGENIIELDFDESYFISDAYEESEAEEVKVTKIDENKVKVEIQDSIIRRSRDNRSLSTKPKTKVKK